MLLLLLLLVTYFYSSCQMKLKSWPLCKDIFPSWSLPLTVTPRITTVSRRLLCTRASIHTHLLRHTEILGAKQKHPIFQIKKLRLILSKFPQRRQSQNPTQVRINQVCPPLRSLCWSVWGHQQPPASGVAFPTAPPVLFRVEKLFASHRPRLAAWDALGFHKLAQLPAHTVTI